jgi:uncharacterized iron-regulated membrane protein
MLEDLGNIGDFLGGIGVVITLAYLAFQIRKNTQSVRAAALDSISSSISDFMDKVAQDPALTKLWFDGLSGTVELSENDNRRFNLLLISLVRRWENAFHQSRAGILESQSWSGMADGLTFVFSSPGAQTWWERSRGLFSADFVAFAEKAFRAMQDSRQSAVFYGDVAVKSEE